METEERACANDLGLPAGGLRMKIKGQPEDTVVELGYLVAAMLRTASAALDADVPESAREQLTADVQKTIDLAIELTGPMISGAQTLERLAGRGPYRLTRGEGRQSTGDS